MNEELKEKEKNSIADNYWMNRELEEKKLKENKLSSKGIYEQLSNLQQEKLDEITQKINNDYKKFHLINTNSFIGYNSNIQSNKGDKESEYNIKEKIKEVSYLIQECERKDETKGFFDFNRVLSVSKSNLSKKSLWNRKPEKTKFGSVSNRFNYFSSVGDLLSILINSNRNDLFYINGDYIEIYKVEDESEEKLEQIEYNKDLYLTELKEKLNKLKIKLKETKESKKNSDKLENQVINDNVKNKTIDINEIQRMNKLYQMAGIPNPYISKII